MTATEDKPTMAERYVRAAASLNLTPDADERTDLDILIAAGLSVQYNPDRIAALRVLRMVDTQRLEDLQPVVEHYEASLAAYLARGGRRSIPQAGRRALIMAVLNWQMHKACDFCGGTGRVPRDVDAEGREAAVLTQMCDVCHSSGIKPLSRAVPSAHGRTALWLVDQMAMHAREAIKDMRRRLAPEEPKP